MGAAVEDSVNDTERFDGGVMRKVNTKPPSVVPDEEPDPAIALYETMPIEQVKAELKRSGIDPRETIATIKELVNERLRRRHDRRSHHLETFVAFLRDFTKWTTVPAVCPC
jgi:hypothetical protein